MSLVESFKNIQNVYCLEFMLFFLKKAYNGLFGLQVQLEESITGLGSEGRAAGSAESEAVVISGLLTTSGYLF